MCEKRNDLTPITEAFLTFFDALVRHSIERIGDDLCIGQYGNWPELLTKKQAAQMMGLGTTAFGSVCEAYGLKPVTVKGLNTPRYRRSDVVRCIQLMKRLE